ncbi:phage protein Gp27 family protein [Ralstonia syzygii]|nr:phage protein Gp27 family protein [Ralstonia syzygii]
MNQKRFRQEVQARAEAAAANIEKIAKKGGLSAESVDALRREILGIAG